MMVCFSLGGSTLGTWIYFKKSQIRHCILEEKQNSNILSSTSYIALLVHNVNPRSSLQLHMLCRLFQILCLEKSCNKTIFHFETWKCRPEGRQIHHLTVLFKGKMVIWVPKRLLSVQSCGVLFPDCWTIPVREKHAQEEKIIKAREMFAYAQDVSFKVLSFLPFVG